MALLSLIPVFLLFSSPGRCQDGVWDDEVWQDEEVKVEGGEEKVWELDDDGVIPCNSTDDCPDIALDTANSTATR